MRARSAAVLSWMGLFGGVVACGQAGSLDGVPAPVSSGDEAPASEGREAPPQPLFRDLGSNARRMKVIVLPGDAAVEIDGVPVRRKEGIIELVGKVGETHRLRVVRGAQYLERDVSIPQEGGGSPLVLDLAARPVVRPAGAGSKAPGAAAPSASAAPSAAPVNPLLPPDLQ